MNSARGKHSVAIVGATGMVGQAMLRVLEERHFPAANVKLLASAKSAGKKLIFQKREQTVEELGPDSFKDAQFALFSAGTAVSKTWCPVAAQAGAIVIDNSSAWRMDKDVPLVVPEVNMEAAQLRPKGIIANPNCSTIQMVVALKPIHDAAKIRRIVVSTYQAISGAGATATEAFRAQCRADGANQEVANGAIGSRLVGNLLMTWKPDAETLYSEEELKMVRETKKIFGDESIRVSPTTVRVPVVTAHSEAVSIETERPIRADEVRELLKKAPGIVVIDDFMSGKYPKPFEAAGTDPVYVGRIRDDIGNPGGIQMWIVSDNLRKGAALNAIQIAENLL